jgi:hypothetical protein
MRTIVGVIKIQREMPKNKSGVAESSFVLAFQGELSGFLLSEDYGFQIVDSSTNGFRTSQASWLPGFQCLLNMALCCRISYFSFV